MVFGLGRKQQDENENNDNAKLVVNKLRCPQNHPCPSIRVCPAGALTQKGFAAPIVDEAKCTHCGKCVRYCPMRALKLE